MQSTITATELPLARPVLSDSDNVWQMLARVGVDPDRILDRAETATDARALWLSDYAANAGKDRMYENGRPRIPGRVRTRAIPRGFGVGLGNGTKECAVPFLSQMRRVTLCGTTVQRPHVPRVLKNRGIRPRRLSGQSNCGMLRWPWLKPTSNGRLCG
jgi:hypothetical protein